MRTIVARSIGRALAAAGDPAGEGDRRSSWGMSAALPGTMLANVFYLTMSFYYFYVFVALLARLADRLRAEADEPRRPRAEPSADAKAATAATARAR